MRSIDVGVGHDNDLIVTQFVDICFFIVFSFYSETNTNTLNNVHYRLAFEYLMPHNFFDIKYLSTQR